MKFLKTVVLICLIYSVGYVFCSNNNTNYKKPSVLFIGGAPYFSVAKRLYKEGFNIGWTNAQSVTWNKVKRYNVLILTNGGTSTAFGYSNSDFTLTQTNKKNISVFMRFLSRGGGILYNPYYCEMKIDMPPQQAFGKQIGLHILFRDIIFDKDNKIATAWRIPFGWTKNISLSPITGDVKGLWYPTKFPVGVSFLGSFIPNKKWNIVIKGSDFSYTKRYSLMSGQPKGKSIYSTEVPLAAYRKFGKGRIVVVSIASDYLFAQSAATTLENIVLYKGLAGKPSDGYKLLENSLKWLSEPSMKENVLGGAKMDMSLLKNPFKVQIATPYNWNSNQIFPSFPHSYKGVIGAQAKYVNGKWNIQDWVNAGKKAGLSYIVFLEPFSSLTKNKLVQLEQECKKYTTNDFAVISGFTIKDEIGNHYFFCGNNTLYPSKKFLSSDGKEFVSYDPGVGGNPYQKGQLAMTLLNYAYTQAGFKETSGDYLYSNIPFTDFFSDWDAMGVITSINNTEIQNRTEGYLEVAQSGQGPTPIAINIISHPSQISKVKWWTIINGNNIQFVDQYWDRWHFYPSDPTNIYITDGPKIENWSFIGPRDYDWANKTNYVWQNYQWKVYGKVQSDVGLKEITIYNGTHLFRKFFPENKKEYSFTLDLTHDREYNLILIAKDINGKEAISENQWAGNWRLEEFMCADRNNQFVASWLIRKDRTYIHPGGPTATPDKRTGSNELAPAGTFFSDSRLGAPAFDGSPGGDPDFFSPVICNSVKGQISLPAVCDSIRLFDSGDVNIGEGIRKWNFSDNINVYNVWNTLWRTQPATEFTVKKTHYVFQMDPNSPIAGFILNINIKLLKDIPNNGFSIGFIEPRESTTWAIKSGDKFYSGTYNHGKQQNISEPFNKGDYVADLNSPLGGMALFPLTNGLQIMTTVPGKNYIYINLPKQNSPQKKGQTKNIKLLLIGIPRNTSLTRNFYPSVLNKVVKRFYQKFGLSLNGKTGYTVNTANGKIISQRYLLNINGGKNRCFSGSITGNLISTLPIVVSNLENRDSVYLYDRGLNKARPIGVYNGKAYAVITLHGTRNLFIGEPVICDAPDLFVQVTQTGENRWHIGINNPTNKIIKTHIMLNPYFEPFKGKIIKGEITIKPGTSISKTI
jgi:hypothetical protein